jgi:PST family polysaccharide transporter
MIKPSQEPLLLSESDQSDAVSLLKLKSARGALITIGNLPLGIGIQLAATVILARLLVPGDYGIVAMASSVTALAGVFGDFGLGCAAVQSPNLSHGQQSNLFWIGVACGLVVTILCAASAPLVASFYGEPRVMWVTVALSMTFLVGSLGNQHGARLVRNMQFGKKVIAETASKLIALCTAVSLALAGKGYWALVGGTMSGVFSNIALQICFANWVPGRFEKGLGARKLAQFGMHVTASGLLDYFKNNLAGIVIGRNFGAAALGNFGRAYALVLMPVSAIGGTANTVAFPALSRLQGEPDSFRSYFRQMTACVCLVSIPIMILLALLADELILVALGPGWHQVSTIFRTLALGGLVQSVTALWGPTLIALGESKRWIKLNTWNACFLGAGILIGMHWGPVGVAWGMTAASYAGALAIGLGGFYRSPIRPGDLVIVALRPLLASLGAATATFVAAPHMALDSILLSLILKIAFFGTSVIVGLLALPGRKSDLHMIMSLLRTLRGKP